MVSFAREYTNGTRIINPTSKNTGMDTINPAITIAQGALSFPNTLSNVFASRSAPPEISSIFPSIAPRPTTTAINPRVPPIPFSIVPIIVSIGIPAATAVIILTKSNETNA